MTYKFNDKYDKKIIKMIISIAPLLAFLLVFFYIGWITAIIAFIVSAFDFYYSRNNNRKNKSRIKELSIIDDEIKISFFYKSKDALTLKKVDYTISMNETQIIFTNKDESIVLGIANKEDMDESEKWDNLIRGLSV
jgi:hypothetical protein